MLPLFVALLLQLRWVAYIRRRLGQRLDVSQRIVESHGSLLGCKANLRLADPSTLFSACLTVMGQDEHVMPGTKSVTVCEAAQTDELNPAARTIAVKIFS